jgi:hypothetical protein
MGTSEWGTQAPQSEAAWTWRITHYLAEEPSPPFEASAGEALQEAHAATLADMTPCTLLELWANGGWHRWGCIDPDGHDTDQGSVEGEGEAFEAWWLVLPVGGHAEPAFWATEDEAVVHALKGPGQMGLYYWAGSGWREYRFPYFTEPPSYVLPEGGYIDPVIHDPVMSRAETTETLGTVLGYE